MSLAGAMGGHTVVAKLLTLFGTEEQKRRYLPPMATGELRATMALTEPGGGSRSAEHDDHRAARRRRPGDQRLQDLDQQRPPVRADRAAVQDRPGRRGRGTPGISVLLVEHGPGLTVSRDLPKLGYKGVESLRAVVRRLPRAARRRCSAAMPGKGFAQMMKGLETGRIQVASRALGVATAALEDALAYAQQRESFGQPIWKHQSVGNYLADMATKLTAARQLTRYAAERYDSGERCDMEAGMAKLFASEVAMEIALNAVRIHGGYGYSTEYDVERYFRDAPLMIVGEGTNEIQRNVIAAQLVSPAAGSDARSARGNSADDRVDQAPSQRGVGVDGLAGQHQIGCAPTAYPTGDADGAAGAGDQAQAQLGQARTPRRARRRLDRRTRPSPVRCPAPGRAPRRGRPRRAGR